MDLLAVGAFGTGLHARYGESDTHETHVPEHHEDSSAPMAAQRPCRMPVIEG